MTPHQREWGWYWLGGTSTVTSSNPEAKQERKRMTLAWEATSTQEFKSLSPQRDNTQIHLLPGSVLGDVERGQGNAYISLSTEPFCQLVLNSRPSGLYLPNDGIIGICYAWAQALNRKETRENKHSDGVQKAKFWYILAGPVDFQKGRLGNSSRNWGKSHRHKKAQWLLSFLNVIKFSSAITISIVTKMGEKHLQRTLIENLY